MAKRTDTPKEIAKVGQGDIPAWLAEAAANDASVQGMEEYRILPRQITDPMLFQSLF